jgi:hypothetical protein
LFTARRQRSATGQAEQQTAGRQTLHETPARNG